MDNTDHPNNTAEETKDGVHNDDQNVGDTEGSQEELIEQIVHILNNLFDPNNLANNAYLIYKAQGASFYIPVRVIYDEKSIKAKTLNKDIVNQALERAENVLLGKKGDVIEQVKPKHDQLKKNITIKGIAREDENEFKQFVNSLEDSQEGIVNWMFNSQLNIITILCRDEKFTTELFNRLSKSTFKDAAIDCSFHFESLYILALENMKKRERRPMDFQQNRQFMMPQQYQMQAYFFNQMNNGFMKNNYYPPNNYYMQPPWFDQGMNPMGMQMNPNMNPSMGFQPNYYNKNDGSKPFNKKPFRGGGSSRGGRGGRGGRYQRGGSGGDDYKSANQPTNVEVNDNDFPPLGNENTENQ